MNVVFGIARGGACGFVKAIRVRGSGFGCPLRGGRRKTPRLAHGTWHTMGGESCHSKDSPHPIPEVFFAVTQARKGSMSRCAHRPSTKSDVMLGRRVNSAIRERGRLDLLRRPRAPVVTDCYIDPSTRTGRTSFALRLRLRRRSRAAAQPSACADTRAPSVVNASRAC